MATPVIQFKRGSAGIAGTVPALRPGEPAFSTNNFDFFIGFDTSVSGNKFFGSHRYWDREDGTNSLGLNFVDKNGSKFIQIKSENTLVGSGYTLTLPPTQGAESTVLTNDGLGNLSWSSGSLNATFTGITTVNGNFLDVNVPADFSGITTFSNATANTLGDPNTGAVQIDGGLGINGNVTVGSALSVTGTTSLTTLVFPEGTGIGVTGIDNDLSTVSEAHDTLVSAKAVKDYVDAQVDAQDLDFQGDDGVPLSIDLDSETFTIAGTPDEINTVGSGNSITVGLVDNVKIATSLVVGSATTLNSTGINVGMGSVTAQDLHGHLDARYIDIINDNTLPTVNSLDDSDEFLVYDLSATKNGTVSPQIIREHVYANIGGGVSISAGGTATIQPDSVGLGTDTVGQYAKTITGGFGLSATTANADDSTEYTIDVNVGTGITITSDAVTLKGAATLTDRVLPLWDDVNGQLVDSVISYVVGAATTINSDLHITGTANIGSISGTASTATRATLVDTTGTTNDATYYMLFADTSAGELSETVRVSAAASLNPGTGTFSVGVIQAGSIKSATGSNAITVNAAGTIETASDLTINGDLIVNGTTTQVNTSEITVEDRTIELGVVNGNLPTDTTWDLGILMNYGESGAGKTSALIWESSNSRFKLASDIDEAVGITTNAPQITVSTYAPLEISELWINNTCTGGDVKVIGCVGSELQLQNITIDAGTF